MALLASGCGDTEISSNRQTGSIEHVARVGDSSTTSTASTSIPTRLDVVAVEYGWSGIPDELPAGQYPVSFRNDGTEAHEVSIFRNPDQIPLDELLRLGPEGMGSSVDVVGSLIAGAGQSADHELVVTLEPGTYEVVCFIPAPDNRAHFEHGMHRTLEVG